MDTLLNQIYQTLQKLTGLHRQLLEAIRAERIALVDADLRGVEKMSSTKHSLVEDIVQVESQRVQLTSQLSMAWKRPLKELTLSNVIIAIQGVDPKGAEQLRSAYNALTILIQRITEQNNENKTLIERSLNHIFHMKKNVLSEASSKSNTYTQQGQRTSGVQGSRIISKEA